MVSSPEDGGCPLGCPVRSNDSWPRWIKMRDGSVLWFHDVVGWDGEWIQIGSSTGFYHADMVGLTSYADVGEWIDCRYTLRATSIRWSEVVAHGEVDS